MAPVVVRTIVVKPPTTPAKPVVQEHIISIVSLDVANLQESVEYPGLWS